MELRRVGHTIALLPQAAADKISNALFLVHLPIVQGFCPGVGMVVAREHHVDAGLLRGLGNGLLGGGVHTRHLVGVIGRLVGNQDLPGGLGGLGVGFQLL